MSATEIVREFGILHRTFLDFVSKTLSEIDLLFADSIFLVNIGDIEGITQDGLAKFLAVDKAAVARSVKRMEAGGYVRIARPSTDKRAKKLYLTEKGRSLAELLNHQNEIWVDRVMEEIEPDLRTIVVRSIRRMSRRAKTLR